MHLLAGREEANSKDVRSSIGSFAGVCVFARIHTAQLDWLAFAAEI